MYDFLENLDAAAESRMDRLYISGTLIKCPSCDKLFDFTKEGNTLSPNPYEIPVCNECVDKYIKECKNDSRNNN